MALYKSIDLGGFGVPAQYWRIVGWSVDRLAGIITYDVAGYVSQAVADQGAQPLPGSILTVATNAAALGVATLDAVDRPSLYLHAKRSTDPVTCTQAMIDSGHYTPDMLGKLVMPEAVPNPLSGASDA